MDQINKGNDITITNPNMTRFMMTLNNAVDLVLYAFEHGNLGDIYVQKAPAATIQTLAGAMISLLKSESKIKIIGTRHGEKLFESLSHLKRGSMLRILVNITVLVLIKEI